ncbi:MAG TPA: hypothetical protein VN688_31580 [Gemmataceae bacterium]|nr:hypothetical protein [Gemmataceae bacterium]
MNAEDRAKLQAILASFDEAGLIALANKGLVRRAQKDLEAGGLQHEETEEAILVRGPGWVVSMPPAGPAHATDDTKATGASRQILTATMYLRDQWTTVDEKPLSGGRQPPESSSAQGADDPRSGEGGALQQALLDLTLDDLQKWAGKTIFREALALVKSGVEVEVELHAGITIRLIRQEVEARLLPTGGKKSARTLLDQMLTTAPRSFHKRWVIAAVLALQQSHGRTFEEAVASAPAESAGAARTRAQVLDAAHELLEAMVSTGLAHPSPRMVERLFTLSVSALAVHMPRLARLVRALADEVSQILARDAAADTGRLFDRLCLSYALARALAAAGAQPPLALVGQHRTQYDPAGDLQLTGVGAHPWQTASGYEGITVLLWDRAGKRFLTWTASRPTGSPGHFNMEQSYRTEAMWTAGGPPERIGRSQFTLRQARVNAMGRLSTSESAIVADVVPAEPEQIDFAGRAFTNWRTLHDYTLNQYPIGLTEKNPLDRLIVLRPAQWGERSFDELQQWFCWHLQDDEANTLALTLPWAGVNEDAIEFLEALNPARDRLTAVLVRLVFSNKGLLLEPLALFSQGTPNGHKVLNPAFDRNLIVSRQSALLARLRQKYGRDRIATVMTADEEWDADHPETRFREGVCPGLRTRLGEVERTLLQIAEAGLGRLNETTRQRLGRLSVELDRAGLREMGRGLGELEQPTPAAGVIWNAYLCRLHREAMSLHLSSPAG